MAHIKPPGMPPLELICDSTCDSDCPAEHLKGRTVSSKPARTACVQHTDDTDGKGEREKMEKKRELEKSLKFSM